jgi:hypothetical protein
MQRFAMLIHEELVENGVDSTSNSYYSRIDAAMRQRYPDRFDDAPIEVKQPHRQTGSVVARGVEILLYHAIKLLSPRLRPQSPSAWDYLYNSMRRRN